MENKFHGLGFYYILEVVLRNQNPIDCLHGGRGEQKDPNRRNSVYFGLHANIPER